MKRITTGILAHVDAGKTTLSEGILYAAGEIRTLGRVDNQNAFLDTDEIERKRGITVFSKQAIIETDGTVITILDTPGHVDFTALTPSNTFIKSRFVEPSLIPPLMIED